MTPLARALALPVRAYRLLLSPWVGHGCRYQPTCSAYALDALDRHGGIVNKFLGDGFLALFGAPLEAPDPAHRAGTT